MGWRDRWTLIALFIACWILFAMIEAPPFVLQGAVIESLVERGRMHFVHGNMRGEVFENLDTKTPSFRNLFNIFPYGDVYHVNHAPGQFLLAAPWYAASVSLGWRFETDDRLVWRFLAWTLTAPLGALAVACLFTLARAWGASWAQALLASLLLSLCSPWWAAAGVIYHDSIAVALILAGITIWQYPEDSNALGATIAFITAGALIAFAVVTTYLVAVLALAVIVAMLASRRSWRCAFPLLAGFVPVLAILPVTNLIIFRSSLATGYSVGGFSENYPKPFDWVNAWEKIGFYLWHPEYGLASLFPAFLVCVAGFFLVRPLKSRIRLLLAGLTLLHFLFIISMGHHGSVGWGMGRFFLPLYPILALGLPALWALNGWKGIVARTVLMASMCYSFAFAFAAAWSGVQGVMEPPLPSLKLRLLVDHFQFHQNLPWVAILVGIAGELFQQTYLALGSAIPDRQSIKQPADRSQPSSAAAAVGRRSQRRRK